MHNGHALQCLELEALKSVGKHGNLPAGLMHFDTGVNFVVVCKTTFSVRDGISLFKSWYRTTDHICTAITVEHLSPIKLGSHLRLQVQMESSTK